MAIILSDTHLGKQCDRMPLCLMWCQTLAGGFHPFFFLSRWQWWQSSAVPTQHWRRNAVCLLTLQVKEELESHLLRHCWINMLTYTHLPKHAHKQVAYCVVTKCPFGWPRPVTHCWHLTHTHLLTQTHAYIIEFINWGYVWKVMIRQKPSYLFPSRGLRWRLWLRIKIVPEVQRKKVQIRTSLSPPVPWQCPGESVWNESVKWLMFHYMKGKSRIFMPVDKMGGLNKYFVKFKVL